MVLGDLANLGNRQDHHETWELVRTTATGIVEWVGATRGGTGFCAFLEEACHNIAGKLWQSFCLCNDDVGGRRTEKGGLASCTGAGAKSGLWCIRLWREYAEGPLYGVHLDAPPPFVWLD